MVLRTVINFLKHNYNNLKGKQILLNLISITEVAQINIENYLKRNNLNVEIIVEHKYNKVFLNHFNLNEPYQKILNDFEEKIWGEGNNNILGYQDSQVLLVFLTIFLIIQ